MTSLYDLLPFLAPAKGALVLAGFALALIGASMEQLVYYSKTNDQPHWLYGRGEGAKWYAITKHRADFVRDTAIYWLAIVATPDVWLLLGLSMSMRVIVQGGVNLGVGRPFIDSREQGSWDLYVIDVPKPHGVLQRIMWTAVGLLIIVGRVHQLWW